MTDRPILFSAAMVRALLAGDKTQTRRLASSKPMQRVQVGDRLWVKETHCLVDCDCLETCRVPGKVYYPATNDGYREVSLNKLRPSIFMPRWASRLTLTVTETRTQPLVWIDDRDARAEGLERVRIDPGCSHWSDAQGGTFAFPRFAYASLWNSLHRAPGTQWDDNPDVIAITFTVSHRNIDA